MRDVEGTGVAGGCSNVAGRAECCLIWSTTPGCAAYVSTGIDVCASGESEDGGSEPKPGFSGVRNGDLNGLCSVLFASFNRRRLACGVDIFAGEQALVIDKHSLRQRVDTSPSRCESVVAEV